VIADDEERWKFICDGRNEIRLWMEFVKRILRYKVEIKWTPGEVNERVPQRGNIFSSFKHKRKTTATW
jgi:hypothetical protein